MLSIFVTITIKSEFRERFIEASFGDATGSVKNEPGCFRFDVHEDESKPNIFYLYEVYTDQAAFEAHTKTPHYLQWRSTVHDWFDGEATVVRMNTVFPSEGGWKKQKPHLLNW